MIESFLAWSRKAFDRPKLVVALAAVLTIVFVGGMIFLQIDNDISHMIPEKNAARDQFHKFEHIFGSSEYIFIGVQTPNVYSPEMLAYLGTLSAKIKSLNSTLPAKNISRVLKISGDDALKVIQMLSEQGVYDSGSLKDLLTDKTRMVSEGGLSEKLSSKIFLMSKFVSMANLYSLYDIPVKDVQSLANADYIQGAGDKFSVTKLFDSDKTDAAGIARLKERVNGWDVYKDVFVSSDGKLAGILVQLNAFEKDVRSSVYQAIKVLVKDEKPASSNIFISGEPVIVDSISEFLIHDMALLIPLVLLVVVLVLIMTFRNWEGVLYPSLAVVLSCIWALGTMSFCGVPINMISTILPVLLVAMGSAYGLHFMNSYFLHRSSDKLVVVRDNLMDIGVSIMMSALAMVAGFGSLATNEFVPIRNFGIFTAVGVFYAFLISLYVIPSLILLSKQPKKFFFEEVEHQHGDKLFGILSWIDRFTKKNSSIILMASLVIVLFCVIGIRMVKVDMNTVGFFKKDTIIRKADTILNKELAGTQSLTIILQSKSGRDIMSPEILGLIENFDKDMRAQFPIICKVLSPGAYLKKMNKEMHGGSESYNIIPENSKQISDYLLLYSGSLDNFMTKNHDGIRVTLSMKRTGTALTKEVQEYAKKWLATHLSSDPDIAFAATGIASVEVELNSMIIHGQLASILLSSIVVFFINLLVFRNFGVTLISLIPMAVGLAINFGVMGFFNIPLNAGTAMISAVAIGVGVDYAIHFIIRYRVAWRRDKDLDMAIHDALTIRGRGIIYNVAAVMLGFLVLVFSQFIPIIQFGSFIALNMAATGFGALFIIPAALRVFGAKKPFFSDEKILNKTIS